MRPSAMSGADRGVAPQASRSHAAACRTGPARTGRPPYDVPDRRCRLRRRGDGRAARGGIGKRVLSATAVRTSPATPTTLTTRRHPDAPIRPAHLPHQLAPRSSTTCRASPTGGPTSTACWPMSTASWCRCRSTARRSTALRSEPCRDEAGGRFLASRAEPVERSRPRADVVVSKVGRELYETFFQGYTRKQWGMDPSRARQVGHRARADPHQHRRPLLHRHASRRCRARATRRCSSGCSIIPTSISRLGVDFRRPRPTTSPPITIFTGPIDEYLRPSLRQLPYRSLTFEHETHDRVQFQPVGGGQLPRPSGPIHADHRVQASDRSEAAEDQHHLRDPQRRGDPYYPIPRPENQALFKRYEALATRSRRDLRRAAGTYRYYNMDQVVGQALATHRRLATAMAGPVPAAHG